MATVIDCPSCSRKLRVPDEMLGRKVKCPQCATAFVAGEADGEEPEAPVREKPASHHPRRPAPPPEDEFDDREEEREERPRRRRAFAEDEDEDYPRRPRARRFHGEPHRGALVLVLGIVSVACLLLGGVIAVIIGFGALLFIPGLVVGIIAWVMGGRDLAKMKRRVMDPEGQGMTTGGWICGIVGTILNGLGLVCCVAGVILMVAYFGVLFKSMSDLDKQKRQGPGPRPKFEHNLAPLRLQDYLPGTSPATAR